MTAYLIALISALTSTLTALIRTIAPLIRTLTSLISALTSLIRTITSLISALIPTMDPDLCVSAGAEVSGEGAAVLPSCEVKPARLQRPVRRSYACTRLSCSTRAHARALVGEIIAGDAGMPRAPSR